MKKALLFSGLVVSILLLMFFRMPDQKSDPNIRFKYYEQTGKKNQSIKVMYLTWSNKNLPNFIKLEDYNKFVDQEKLIQFCFYVDSKNPKATQFNKTIRDQFKKKIPVEISGTFYKTKRFDNHYPNPLFEELRRINELGYDSKDKEFKVFVID